MMPKKQYLGDGVYCVVEHGMLKLTTENGYAATNTIFLEQEVYVELVAYYNRVIAAVEAAREEAPNV